MRVGSFQAVAQVIPAKVLVAFCESHKSSELDW
jgi:hypothetical protein